jgi:hypothetical protein
LQGCATGEDEVATGEKVYCKEKREGNFCNLATLLGKSLKIREKGGCRGWNLGWGEMVANWELR